MVIRLFRIITHLICQINKPDNAAYMSGFILLILNRNKKDNPKKETDKIRFSYRAYIVYIYHIDKLSFFHTQKSTRIPFRDRVLYMESN